MIVACGLDRVLVPDHVSYRASSVFRKHVVGGDELFVLPRRARESPEAKVTIAVNRRRSVLLVSAHGYSWLFRVCWGATSGL